MKYNKMSRRMFLQGTGGTLLSIPFLESLVPREARADNGVPVKRYLSFSAAFHVGHNRNWYPKMTTLSNALAIPGSPHMGSYDRLSTFMQSRPELSRVINASMNPFINQMMIYKGLDIPTHGFHTAASYLGAAWEYHQGITEAPYPNPMIETIDRLVAKNAKFDAAKRKAVRIGDWGASYEKNAVGDVAMVYPLAYTPIDAYKILFNNGQFPESGQAPVVHPRRDLLTRVIGDYRRIANGRQIGSVDKVVLQNAMDKMSDLQAGLTQQAVLTCRHRGQDTSPAGNSGYFRMDDSLTLRNYANLIQAIFLCDISRVVVFGADMNNSHDLTGNNDYHGNISHNLGGILNGVSNWQSAGDLYGSLMSKLIAPTLTAMDSALDAANNKSFLNNGLAHISVESFYPHRQANMPTMTVGSLNGALPTGYLVNYCDPTRPFTFAGGTINGGDPSFCDDDPASIGDPMTDKHSYDYPGIPYQRFLVTLLQAMGLSPSDYEDESMNPTMLNRSDAKYGAQNNGITRVGGYGPLSVRDPAVLGDTYHHDHRLMRYNFNYYKDPIPQPPKV